MLVANYPLTTNISSTVGADEDNILLTAHFDRPDKSSYEGTFNNSVTTKYFAIASCLPADMIGEYNGIYTGNRWEVQLELKAPNYSNNSKVIMTTHQILHLQLLPILVILIVQLYTLILMN